MVELTQARLKEVLTYGPGTGEFRRKGTVCRTRDLSGYVVISVAGTQHKAHRLAFLYMLGRWPDGDVDHVNRARDDNRWSNLREATRAQNNANAGARRNNQLGVRGVCLTTRGYKAQIKIDGKSRHIGYFKTADGAAEAYRTAAKQAFGEFAA